MRDFEKLELSTETIRELTGDELTQVAGGAAVTTDCALTQKYCPSGYTWTARCEIDTWAC